MAIAEVAERHRDHAEIQLFLAVGAFNAITNYGRAQASAQFEDWGQCPTRERHSLPIRQSNTRRARPHSALNKASPAKFA